MAAQIFRFTQIGQLYILLLLGQAEDSVHARIPGKKEPINARVLHVRILL